MSYRILFTLIMTLVTAGLSFPVASQAQTDPRPVIRISSGAEDNVTLDPDRATSTNDVGVVAEIFNGLVRFAPGSADPKSLEADLAESWETSKDSKVWTFHLRHGVKFQGDWGELTSADVVYTMQRAADPKRSSFAANFAVIDKAEATDPYTVRITLKYPDATFLGHVSNYHGGNIVSMKAAEKYGNQFGNHPVGTGPFAFSQHVTQQYVQLVANDQYFRGKPKLAGITYRMIPSDSDRELAFNSGELDIIAGKREQRWVERARKRSGTNVDIFRPGEFRTLFINRMIKPLDNVKVRQALAESINVDEIMHYVGADVATKGCSAVPPGYLGEDCSSGGYPYNIAHARKLLSEAGFPNGIAIKSVVSNISEQEPIMEIVQSQLAKAGIKLTMEVVDHSTYQAQSRKDLSALVFYGAARFPNADAWLSEFYDSAAAVNSPTAMSNFSHCSIADADIRAARVEPDPNKQLALWKSAQRKIHDDVCSVPLFGLLQVWVHSNKVVYGYDLKGSLNLAPPITETTSLTGH
ncbi:ABC transporter substrate-binding protein [Caballeronia sordidicola]|uniref:Oligopeptide ABC transporter, periplasmic oligopeptide-binding protein OppA n=1 Tax=Caballeronia sordidicola TaxID=196367 RepID=A0A226X1R8_CABSO|nr:ABC transporter substrate-binding protein [Caballeronia sordidicola]OXC76828.1 Oligopeptide ABC transporter, periplasmic oligopeptide-binding protein OppA [Caballeronia sordidicola]